MADLTLEDALRLAGSLVTIGHPYQQVAINATAWDLIQMCKGTFVDGKPVSPEKQAEDLIREARNWEEGWPDRGGTRRLKELFREMYAAKEPAETPRLTIAAALERGILAPPCQHCAPGEECCEYGGPKTHAQYKADEEWHRARAVGNPKPVANFKPLTEKEMKKALDDEKRRKEAQLRKLDEDKVS